MHCTVNNHSYNIVIQVLSWNLILLGLFFSSNSPFVYTRMYVFRRMTELLILEEVKIDCKN